MARGKRKATASSSRPVPEDDGTAVADHVETSDSIQMTTDVEEFEAVSGDVVEVDESMVENLSQPSIPVFSSNDKENTVKKAAASINGGEVETVLEEAVSEPNKINEHITDERNGENVDEVAVKDGESVLKEVINGEDVAEAVTGNGEGILEEEGKTACIIAGNDLEKNAEEESDEDTEASNEGELAGKEDEVAGQQSEDNTEQTHKENVEKRSAQTLNKPRKRKRGKKGAKNSKKLAFEGKKKKVHSNGDVGVENGDALRVDDSNREDTTEQDKGDENNNEKVEESGKQRPTKSRKRKRGKNGKRPGRIALEKAASNGEDKTSLEAGSKGEDDQDLEKGVSEGKDVPESSLKKKSSGRVEGMGLIFMCNSETKKDCYRHNILGLPANKREIVEHIYKGMRLFLYDVDLKLMYGIYKAAAPGGFNLEPKAFKSQFPSQVRFTVLEECNPLPEEKFKNVIKKNYYTKAKFRCELTSEQVKELCRLFTAGRQRSASKKARPGLKKENTRVVDRERRKPGVDRSARPKAEVRRGERDRVIKRYRVDRGRRQSPVRENIYPHYERDVVVPALDHLQPFSRAPVAHVSHLPSRQPYVYDRPFETDAYRRAPLVVRDDPYRREILHDPQDRFVERRRYGLESKPELHNSYRQDSMVYQPEAPSYVPLASYQERVEHAYRPADLPVEYYSSGRSMENRSALQEYSIPSSSVPEYHPGGGGLRPEYRSSASLRRYPY